MQLAFSGQIYGGAFTAMSGIHRDERPALIALALILSAIVFMAFFETGMVRQPMYEDGRYAGYEQTERTVSEAKAGADDFNFWRDPFPQYAMALFAFIATGTGVVGVIWLKQTLDATTAMAGQAQKANEIALQSVEAQHRPWLDVEVTDAEHIITGSRIISGSFSVKVTNLSDYPAISVHVWADFYSSNAGLLAGGREAERLVQHIEATFGSGMRGYIIFPDDHLERGFRGLTAKTLSNIVGHELPDDISLSLVVGVIYKSAVATHWHHTAHTFHISTDTQHTFRFREATHDGDTLTLYRLPGNSLIT